METLILDSSFTTPSINFNPHKMDFEISGECRPENVLTFFNPILEWLNEFKSFVKHGENTINELSFNFKLEYYNSSSSKFIFNILKRLKVIEDLGVKVKIIWYYDVLDEDLLESGKELERILNLNFEYIALKD